MAKEKINDKACPDTQGSMRHIKSLNEMKSAGFIAHDDIVDLKDIEKKYTIGMSIAMQKAAANCKNTDNEVSRQFVPSAEELAVYPAEDIDPIGDDSHSPLPGLVHRHRDRVLVMPTMACAVYCRFCFRREKVGHKQAENERFNFSRIYDYLKEHPEVKEVILTGGDPMVMSVRNLTYIFDGLNALDHIQRVRIHSRVPLVRPEMMTQDKINLLAQNKKVVWFSLHVNSIAEWTNDGQDVLNKMRCAGIPMVAQTVLLKNVNDNTEALANLFNKLLNQGIKPYYLHHPDKPVGTHHFRVSIEKGLQLMTQVQKMISGLAVPSYVIDIPGGVASKIPLHFSSVRLEKSDEKTGIRQYLITAPDGKEYSFHDDAF